MVGTRHVWLLISLNLASSFEGHAGNGSFQRFHSQGQNEDYIIDFIMITHWNDDTATRVGSVKDTISTNSICFFFPFILWFLEN